MQGTMRTSDNALLFCNAFLLIALGGCLKGGFFLPSSTLSKARLCGASWSLVNQGTLNSAHARHAFTAESETVSATRPQALWLLVPTGPCVLPKQTFAHMVLNPRREASAFAGSELTACSFPNTFFWRQEGNTS